MFADAVAVITQLEMEHNNGAVWSLNVLDMIRPIIKCLLEMEIISTFIYLFVVPL